MSEQTEIVGGVLCQVAALERIERHPCVCQAGSHKGHGCYSVRIVRREDHGAAGPADRPG